MSSVASGQRQVVGQPAEIGLVPALAASHPIYPLVGLDVHPVGFRVPRMDSTTSIDRVSDGFLTLDLDWRIRSVNLGGARILARPVSELLGRSIWADFPTAVATIFDRHYREAVTSHATSVVTEQYVDELNLWLSIQAYPSTEGVEVVFRDVTEHKLLLAQQQALVDQVLGAEACERARIARDVHDDSLQSLGSLAIQVQLLNHHLPAPSSAVADVMTSLGDQIERATQRLRTLLFTLEPTTGDATMAHSIRAQAAEIFHATATRWTVDDLEVGEELSDVERGQVLRITKEALANTRAHARATEVTVTLIGDADGLEVVIVDRGARSNPVRLSSAPGHRGLASMQDRAELLGGWCTIAPSPHGCTVRCYVPRRPLPGSIATASA